jgi:hypothetical protein
MTADEIVNASLNGLERRKLFVIPGWRYRVLTAILTKLPTHARVAFESSLRGGRVSDGRARQKLPGDKLLDEKASNEKIVDQKLSDRQA